MDAWNVVVERRIDTESSILLFGRSGAQPVVLKLARHPKVEWASGPVLEAFGGIGVVRVLGHVEGADLCAEAGARDGDLKLVKATPDQFTELARLKAIDGKT